MSHHRYQCHHQNQQQLLEKQPAIINATITSTLTVSVTMTDHDHDMTMSIIIVTIIVIIIITIILIIHGNIPSVQSSQRGALGHTCKEKACKLLATFFENPHNLQPHRMGRNT